MNNIIRMIQELNIKVYYRKIIMLCKICSKSYKSFLSLSKHIHVHDISSNKYYDEYFKKINDGKCNICKQETRFLNINNGYRLHCSSKCGRIHALSMLKSNKEKYEHFILKCQTSTTKMWNARTDDEKQLIINKSSNTNRKNIKKLSIAERKERFGWLNKLDEQTKKNKVNEILEKSLFKWNREATIEDKK